MEIFIVLLLAVIIYAFYLILEFFIPVITLFLIIQQHEPIWLWSTILIVWFVARMIIWIMKKGN